MLKQEDLFEKFAELWRQTWALERQGLCAAVYTQITDVENEANGLMSYDRRVYKVDPTAVFPFIAKGDFPQEQKKSVLIPTAADAKGDNFWFYTTSKPAKNWFMPDFAFNDWKAGLGGFGSSEVKDVIIGTPWSTDDIYLRRMVTLPKETDLQRVLLSIHNVCFVQIYINGVLAAEANSSGPTYEQVYLRPEAIRALKPGENLLAIHGARLPKEKMTFVDAGLIHLEALKMTGSR